MARSWLQHWTPAAGESVAPNAGGANFGYMLGGTSVENDGIGPLRLAHEDGTFSRFAHRIGTNGWDSSLVLAFRKEGSDGNQSVTFLSSDSNVWKEDTTNTDDALAGDEVSIGKAGVASGGTAMIWTQASIVFEPDAATLTLVGCNSSGSTNINTVFGPGVQGWFAVIGKRSSSLTLATVESRVEASYSWEGMRLIVGTVTDDFNTAFRSWVNGSAGNQTVTVIGNTSGVAYDDTTHSDTLADGGLIAWEATLNASSNGSLNVEKIASALRNTSGIFMVSVSGSAERFDTGAVNGYFPLTGNMGEIGTEADVKQAIPFDCDFSHLTVERTRNSGGATPTITFRVDTGSGSGAGNQTVTCNADAFFEDTTHTDAVLEGDEVNTHTNAPSGTNYNLWQITMLGEDQAIAAGGVSLPPYRNAHQAHLVR